MKSREVEESEEISRAEVWTAAVWGAKSTVRVQAAAGARAGGQSLVAEKSGVVMREARWKAAVPVLVRVTVWGGEASPPPVWGKVRADCERV